MPAPRTSRAAALEQTVRAAYDIARFTAEDPAAGLPEAGPGHAGRGRARPRSVPSLGDRRRGGGRAGAALRGRGAGAPTGASPIPKAPACRRSSRTSGPATRAASAAVMPARAIPSRCRRSPAGRGAACSATPGTARCATPRAGRARGRGPLCRRACAVAAEVAQGAPPARCRCCSRRPLAAGLLGAYVQATSGGSLYRKASFLLDSLGQRGAARRTWTSTKTRTCSRGKGSAPFDDEGVRTQRAQRGRRRRRAGLFPVELFGAQARHAHHRPCRRFAEPGADEPAHRSRATTSTRCCASWAAACSSPS